MSIKLTGDVMIAQHVSQLFAGYNKWSYSVFFRYDGAANTPSQAFAETVFSAYRLGLGPADQAAHPGTVAYSPIMRDVNGNVASIPGGGSVLLALGSVYHLALVWDSGVQTSYVNSVPAVMGNWTTAIQVANDLIGIGDSRGYLGGTPAGPGRIWTVRDQAMWGNYALTRADLNNLMLSNATPATLGTPATYWWPLSGTPGAAVNVATDPGVRDAMGHAAYNLTELHSDGAPTSTAVYADAMPWQPNAHVTGGVCPNGKAIFVFLTSDNTHSWTPEVSFGTPPTVTIAGPKGGTNIPLAFTPWRGAGAFAGQYKGQFFNIPEPYQVTSTDPGACTFSAPVGWVNTEAGIAAAEVNTPLANYLGRSIYGVESVPKTMRMGYNFSWFIGEPGAVYSPTKNYDFRSWTSARITGTDADGRPTTIAATSTPAAPAYWTVNSNAGQSNGIDLTGIPAAAGLWARGWDDTGPDPANHPTVLGFGVDTADGQTCVEMTQYNNPGAVDSSGHRVGIVRVFNLQPGPGKTNIDVRTTYYQDQDTLHFANSVTYGPGDFTPASPTVLDRSDPYALSADLLRNLATGCGSMRFMDSAMANFSNTIMSEPEQMRRLTDWEWSKPNFSVSIPCASIREWDPTRSPYVYSGMFGGLGETYTATLSAPIATAPASGTVQTITISDASAPPTAATGPVMAGQTLTIGAETLRVLSVSDSDGVSVTVERGAIGTPTSTHAAGAIQVNYRRAVTSLAGWGVEFAGQCKALFEVVTPNRHNLQTPQYPTLANFPAVTFSDNSHADLNQNREPSWVTGPKTFARWVGNPTPTTSHNVTLPAGTNIALSSGANCGYAVPETATCPYEWTAIQASKFPGCVCQVNIPLTGSDAYAYEAAVRVFKYLPPGNDVIVELQNEIWNFSYYSESQAFTTLQWMFDPARYNWPHNYTYVIARTYRLRQIFEHAAAVVGWTGKVRTLLNLATYSGGGILSSVLATMVSYNAPATDIATAPYWGVEMMDSIRNLPDNGKVKALHGMTVEQVMDLACWSMQNYFQSPPLVAAGQHKQLVDFNANVGGINPQGWHLDFYGYEGGPDILFPQVIRYLTAAITATQTVLPMNDTSLFVPGQYLLIGCDGSRNTADYQATSEWVVVQSTDPSAATVTVLRGQAGTTARALPFQDPRFTGQNVRTACYEMARDIERHPNFKICQDDYFLTLQQSGYVNFNLLSYAMIPAGQAEMWGALRYCTDLPGYGDGRDGKFNNLLTLCRPGQANTKPANVNQWTRTVNVRMQQSLDWNAAVGVGGGTGGGVTPGKGRRAYRLAVRPNSGLRR